MKHNIYILHFYSHFNVKNMNKQKHLKEIVSAVLCMNERLTCLIEQFEDLDITSDLESMIFPEIDKNDIDLKYLMNDASRVQYHLKEYRK